MTIYPAKEIQIISFLAEKVIIFAKYSDFADVFLEELANVLSEQTRANENTIKLVQGKQPFYGLIYTLRQVKFETFKSTSRPT